MKKLILHTFSTRLIGSILNFILALITAKYLGDIGRGTISLVVLNISVIMMVNNFVGGSALVYLIPKYGIGKTLLPSYIWALASVFAVYFIITLFNLNPKEFNTDLLYLSLIQAFLSINLMTLLAKEKIVAHNVSALFNVLLLFGGVIIYFFVLNHQTVSSFINALYIGYSVAALISFITLIPTINFTIPRKILSVSSELFKYGLLVQVANIVQLFNYRFGYYLLENNFTLGTAMVGVYSIAVSFAEAFWLISKSIATVQYSKIANSNDDEYSVNLTIKLAKNSLIVTIILLIPVFIIPNSFFVWLLNEDFIEVKKIILMLSPGILFISFSTIFTHYFSGIGKHQVNTIGSTIGFIVTLIAGLIIIPRMGVTGAAITASLSYIVSSIYTTIRFIKHTNKPFSLLRPRIEDIHNLKIMFQQKLF